MTGENSIAVKNRAEKLKIKQVFRGVSNKLQLAQTLCLQHNVSLSEIAMIGDDINDLLLLREVGYSAAPANAPVYIRNQVDFITGKQGGEGAFREFVEHILQENELMEAVLEKYLASKK